MNFFEVVNQKHYSRFFKHNKNNVYFEDSAAFNFTKFGELDFFSSLQLFQGTRKILICNLNLLQTAFCRRAWGDLSEDTYKHNGRIRHERICLQFDKARIFL